MRRLLPIVFVILAAGCQPEEATPTAPASTGATPSAGAPAPKAPKSGRGIAPIGSTAAGGVTPISGSESVEGAGMGGIGQAAKGQAMKAAAGASASGASQGGDGE